MKVVLVTGMSGSGKSVAIRALEDAYFYCIDNLPPALIPQAIHDLQKSGIAALAIAVDSRTGKSIDKTPDTIAALRSQGVDIRVLFLDADDQTLVMRYSETRRRHPMSAQLGEQATVQECVEAERLALGPLRTGAACIDTSGVLPNILKGWVTRVVEGPQSRLTLIFQSFGFKKGLPTDADLVFDVRCLTNPYYDKALRPLSGLDLPVADFIANDTRSEALINDIETFLRRWLPAYLSEQRSYITVAIGCTGGQHRSVYVSEALKKRLAAAPLPEVENLLIRHRNMMPAN